jgi:hypothetical protein
LSSTTVGSLALLCSQMPKAVPPSLRIRLLTSEAVLLPLSATVHRLGLVASLWRLTRVLWAM